MKNKTGFIATSWDASFYSYNFLHSYRLEGLWVASISTNPAEILCFQNILFSHVCQPLLEFSRLTTWYTAKNQEIIQKVSQEPTGVPGPHPESPVRLTPKCREESGAWLMGLSRDLLREPIKLMHFIPKGSPSCRTPFLFPTLNTVLKTSNLNSNLTHEKRQEKLIQQVHFCQATETDSKQEKCRERDKPHFS